MEQTAQRAVMEGDATEADEAELLAATAFVSAVAGAMVGRADMECCNL